jgi:hypothetical protein
MMMMTLITQDMTTKRDFSRCRKNRKRFVEAPKAQAIWLNVLLANRRRSKRSKLLSDIDMRKFLSNFLFLCFFAESSPPTSLTSQFNLTLMFRTRVTPSGDMKTIAFAYAFI